MKTALTKIDYRVHHARVLHSPSLIKIARGGKKKSSRPADRKKKKKNRSGNFCTSKVLLLRRAPRQR